MRRTVSKRLAQKASDLTNFDSKVDESIFKKAFKKFFWHKGEKIEYENYSYMWPVGSFRRTYQDLKKVYHRRPDVFSKAKTGNI